MGQKDCWWFWVLERKLIVKMGKEMGLREEHFFFFLGIIGFYVLSGFRKKKKKKPEFVF